jgi:hypothetical protein
LVTADQIALPVPNRARHKPGMSDDAPADVLAGTARRTPRFGDMWVDVHHTAVLADEWRGHRGRPEACAA